MLKILVAAFAAVLAAAPAQAQWAFAESDRFRVYSEGGEAEARTMARRLERLDDAMRLFTGIKPPAGPASPHIKVTLFQFGDPDDIGKLAKQRGVVGFFIPRAGQSVAFVPLRADTSRDRSSSPGTRQGFDLDDSNIDPVSVLFHEYAHYFMYQHRPAAYPHWYSEGFAELFGTMQLTDTGFALGEPAVHRRTEISFIKVETDQMFDTKTRYVTFPVYGHGWLAVSYLSFKPERRGQLARYLAAVNRGADGRQAAEEIFGDLGALERELNAYRRERAMGMSATFASLPEPKVASRLLAADEAARMPILIAAQAGVTREEARRDAGIARELAEQYPNSLPVALAALEAEFDANDLAKADARAEALANAHPEAVEPHLFRARIALEHADKDAKWLPIARSHFLAANKIDPTLPQALAGYYQTFALAGEQAPEDALIALESAFAAAPFDADLRRLLGHLLLLEKRDAQAKAVLAPVAYRPHAGPKVRKLRELLDKLGSGERQPLIDELTPKLDKDLSGGEAD